MTLHIINALQHVVGPDYYKPTNIEYSVYCTELLMLLGYVDEIGKVTAPVKILDKAFPREPNLPNH